MTSPSCAEEESNPATFLTAARSREQSGFTTALVCDQVIPRVRRETHTNSGARAENAEILELAGASAIGDKQAT